jgi:sugar O-acyltransferase (sialic acid O-acetyltransferase NeuD family)
VSVDDIVLLGAGGHAISCIDVIEQAGSWRIIGLLAAAPEVGRTVFGYRVIGTDAELSALAGRHVHALVCVGQIDSPAARVRLYEAAVRSGWRMPTIVSPRACVSRHATLGEGTIVMHGAVVNAGAVVGSNCIVNSDALVEHGAAVGDHCHVSTGARINGEARVGKGSFIGSGAVIRERASIGEGCVIGMGQLVLADCAAHTKLAGARPA